MSIVVELRNPTPDEFVFEFSEGDTIGRAPNTDTEVCVSSDVRFSVPANSIRTVSFNAEGDLATPQCIDDIAIIESNTVIDALDETPVYYPTPDDWTSLTRDDIQHRFEVNVRSNMKGIVEDRGLGGYGCIATMSRLKSERTGRSAIYSPAALGLRHVDDPNSLHALVQEGKLTLDEAIGNDFDAPASISLRVTNPGNVAVTVNIDVGVVFEQEHTPERQNLTVKERIVIRIESRTTRVITAHGMCMDSTTAAPNNSSLLCTPFILDRAGESMARSGSEQSDLWRHTGRR